MVATANKDGAAGTASMRTLGTGATQAAPGNDSRFSDSRPPNGTAGGDLSGSYPNPQIAAGVITDADVATANKDGATSTPSLRTLGFNVGQALGGATALSSVKAPTSDLALAGFKIVNLGTPTAATDAATMGYVDSVAQGLDAKQSVQAATTGNITLSGTQTIDGKSCVAGHRVLVKDQTDQKTNGIYVVAAGAWTRAADSNFDDDFPGAFTFVEEGSVNADTGWVCTVNAQNFSLGLSNVTWVQFSGAGQITAGGGLTKTGNTLDVGAGGGIFVNPDSIQIASNGVTGAMLGIGSVDLAGTKVTGSLPISNGGTGGTSAMQALLNLGATSKYSVLGPPSTGLTWSIPAATHQIGGGGQGLSVDVIDATSGRVEIPDVVINGGGDVTITWGASVSSGSKRVVIIG